MSRANVAAPSESSFLTGIRALREYAHKHIKEGAVTEDYRADRETVLRLLNETLATELICVLHYRHHHFVAKGINIESIAAEFLVHAGKKQAHAGNIATCIVRLGDKPNFNPERLSTRSRSEYVEADDLVSIIKKNLMAERIAIDSYLEIIRYTRDRDPTTWCVLEQILAIEEGHADELSDMLHDQ